MGWCFKLHIGYNNSSGLPMLTSLVTMVNKIQENLVFDDILLFILFGFSLLIVLQKGFPPKIFTRKIMQVAEGVTRKFHFLLAFCEYASVNFRALMFLGRND